MVGSKRPEATPALVTRHSLREECRSLRILLAEDNAVNQLLALRLLLSAGVIGTRWRWRGLLSERGCRHAAHPDHDCHFYNVFHHFTPFHSFILGRGRGPTSRAAERLRVRATSSMSVHWSIPKAECSRART